MVALLVHCEMLESTAPGVQAESGRPPRLWQARVFVRGGGVQVLAVTVGAGVDGVGAGVVSGWLANQDNQPGSSHDGKPGRAYARHRRLQSGHGTRCGSSSWGAIWQPAASSVWGEGSR